MSIPGNPLPAGWDVAPIGEVTELNPRGFDSDPVDTDLVSFVPMAAVEAGSGRISTPEVRAWGQVKKGYTRFQDGDVIFAKITPCMENGKFALANNLVGGRAAGSTEFHVLRSKSGLAPRLLLYYLLQDCVRRDARAAMKGAAGQLRVPGEFLRDLSIPLPPRLEQDRIVQAVDEHLSGLDAAVAALRRVQANLKRYRAAVLKAASEGRLVPTEAELARQEGRDYEPADVLLERILAERRARWEADELARFAKAGTNPSDRSWNGRYSPPQTPDLTGVRSLPDGWTTASVDQIFRIIDYRGRTPPFADEGIPHLRSSNIKDGKVVWDNLAYVTAEVFEAFMTRGLPERGALLFTTEAPMGEVALAPTGFRFSLAQRMMILQPAEPQSPKFLMYQIMSDRFQAQLSGRGTGSTVTGVSSRNFRPAAMMLPPVAEQERIVEEIERRLTALDTVQAAVSLGLRHADRLRQSILKRAFEGRLVPQDPSDEPASALLERIRATREAAPKSKKRTTATVASGRTGG